MRDLKTYSYHHRLGTRSVNQINERALIYEFDELKKIFIFELILLQNSIIIALRSYVIKKL